MGIENGSFIPFYADMGSVVNPFFRLGTIFSSLHDRCPSSYADKTGANLPIITEHL